MNNTITTRREALVQAYHKTAYANFPSMGTPADTLDYLVRSIGKEQAILAIAEAVNACSPEDGRIRKDVRDWAKSVASNEAQSDLGQRLGYNYYPDAIHPANMNMLAWAAMKKVF